MSGLKIADWGDLSWGKLGFSNEDKIITLAERLQYFGEYEIKRESDFTWCKLKRDYVNFFRIIASISMDNYRDDQIYETILNNKPKAELIHDNGVFMPQEEVGKAADKILKAEGPLHSHLHIISSLLGVVRYNELPYLVKDIIAPLFFKDHPNGRIYFIAIDDLLPKFLAQTRVPYLISIYGLLAVKSMTQGKGIETLNELTGKIGELSVFCSILSSLFFPKFYFFGPARVGSSILFQLDKPYEFEPQQPYDFFGLIRPDESFREDVYIDLGNIQKYRPEMERLGYGRFKHEKSWTDNELESLVGWYIKKVNEMLYEFLNVKNFVDDISGCVSFIKQFNFLHTIQRILMETATILTERSPQVRKPLFFELLDKYGKILGDRAIDNGKKNDAENFKTLLKISNYEKNIKPIMKKIFDPFGDYFAEDFGQTVFKEIHKVVIDGIWADSRIFGDNVKLLSWDKDSRIFVDQGETQTKEDYVVNMLRTVRNTHHGYLDDQRFEKYLSIHSGSTSNYIADLSELFMLGMLSDPKSLLDCQWV